MKIALLKGPVYFEDELLWRLATVYQDHLSRYFGDLGLDYRVDPQEGIAFLRQKKWETEETPLPALFRRDELPYSVSLLGALAREEFHKHQQAHPDNPRFVEEIDTIAGWLAPYFGSGQNDAKERRQLYSIVRKGERFGLLRKAKDDSTERYEVCRIVKLMFSLDGLQEYLARLKAARDANSTEKEADNE